MFLPAVALITLLRIPVFFGGGETIAHLADIPEEKRASLIASGLAEPAVGLKYEYFSLFFFDLWTGGGKVVLYDEDGGDRYVPLTDAETIDLVGESQDALGKPLLYRFPLGWLVILGVVGVSAARMVRDARSLNRG